MPDFDPSLVPDDGADAEAPFDPAQWAVHGVLRAYFDSDARNDAARAAAIMARLAAESAMLPHSIGAPDIEAAPMVRARTGEDASSLARGLGLITHYSSHITRSWLVRGGLAAAVGLVLILTLVVDRGRPARAMPPSLGFDGQFLSTFIPPTWGLFKDDPDTMQRLLEAIATARTQRDEAKREAETAVGEEAVQLRLAEVMHAWTRVYRPLRDLGQWGEALCEMEDALAYTRDVHRTLLIVWEFVVLNDIGDLHAARGDFEAAREAYKASIEARKVYALSRPPPVDVQEGTRSLPPLYWRMGKLALLEGKLDEAWEWQAKAEGPLREFFAEVCRRNEIRITPEMTLWQAFEAVPTEFREPPLWYRPDDPSEPLLPGSSLETEGQAKARYGGMSPNASVVSLVRAHLVQEARLRRHAGNYSEAKAALRRAGTIRYYPVHDEYRLTFAEPLEAAWIAIAEKDYDTALVKVEEARANTRAIQVDYEPNLSKPAVSPMALAELDLLQGAALLGKDSRSKEGRELMENALNMPRRLGEGLAAAERDKLMRQFDPWNQLALQVGN